VIDRPQPPHEAEGLVAQKPWAGVALVVDESSHWCELKLYHRRTDPHQGTAEVRELRQLREENRKLKQVVADLTLDKTILKEALGTKWKRRPDGGSS
jgi:hypothetical protein